MNLTKEERNEIAKVPIETRRYIHQLESQNTALLEALEELQKGIYDFTECPIYAKNFVHRITSEAIRKASK